MPLLPFDVSACNLEECQRSGQCLRYLSHAASSEADRKHRPYLLHDPRQEDGTIEGCDHWIPSQHEQSSIREMGTESA